MEMSERLEKLKQWQRDCEIRRAMWSNPLIEVGDFTYGRPFVHQCDKTTRLKIGKFCSIAGNVHILLGGEHHTNYITTYPFDVLFDGKPTPSKGDVIIGNDVWIGENVTILSGVTIGDGAVIGAGCVIAKDVDPYTIMIGNPARILTKRDYGSPPIAWWDLPLEKIAEIIPILCSRNMMELMEAIS